MSLWSRFTRWWNGAPVPPEEPKPEPVIKPTRAIMRKYQQFREAWVNGDQDTIIRTQAILLKSGYPVPESLEEADLLISKYGSRFQK